MGQRSGETLSLLATPRGLKLHPTLEVHYAVPLYSAPHNIGEGGGREGKAKVPPFRISGFTPGSGGMLPKWIFNYTKDHFLGWRVRNSGVCCLYHI